MSRRPVLSRRDRQTAGMIGVVCGLSFVVIIAFAGPLLRCLLVLFGAKL